MAVNNVPQSSQMMIKVQKGLTSAGMPNYVTRKYSSVKASATDADIYAIASGIGGLQSNALVEIERTNISNLVNV